MARGGEGGGKHMAAARTNAGNKDRKHQETDFQTPDSLDSGKRREEMYQSKKKKFTNNKKKQNTFMAEEAASPVRSRDSFFSLIQRQ